MHDRPDPVAVAVADQPDNDPVAVADQPDNDSAAVADRPADEPDDDSAAVPDQPADEPDVELHSPGAEPDRPADLRQPDDLRQPEAEAGAHSYTCLDHLPGDRLDLRLAGSWPGTCAGGIGPGPMSSPSRGR